MTLSLVRVDDRLIHGQVTTGWTRNVQANLIVVADDQAADNSMQSNLMKMAAPPGVDVEVLPVEEAAEELKAGTWDDRKVLLLLRGSRELLRLVEEGVELEKVNVGNAGGGEGKIRLTKQVAATEEEMEAWRKLNEKGIDLEVQWMPGHQRTDLNKVIRKKS